MFRKLLLSSFFMALLFPWVAGQIITADPEIPGVDDEVTITFDAALGTGGLANCNCDVYIHTGLITDASASGADWKHVVTEWGLAKPEWKMTRVAGENNKYRFRISPSVREFYGVGPGEEVRRLAFVFRDADGSREGKDDGGQDIYYDLFSGTIQLRSPAEKNLVRNLGEGILVSAVSQSPATFSVREDGILLARQNGTELNYEILADDPGKHFVEVTAENESEQRVFTFEYVALAPASTEPGIVLIGDTLMQLALYAPGKESIHVIGSFNDWQASGDFRMTPDADSSTWTIGIGGLSPGQDYTFQYLVDDQLRIADPYSSIVLDPEHDKFIPGITYPGLPAYPSGKTTGIVTLVQPGAPSYEWETENFSPPAEGELVIYELLIRDFLDRHDYSTLIDTLAYLDNLGVNAIELMPVSEFEGNISWGYNPSFHMALDKYYGPINEFKRFVDSCHARGIAVILDVVFNHAFSQSPLAQLYWDAANFRPSPDNPWLNPVARHPFNVGYDFNHESDATRTFVDKVIRYWLGEFRIDGFRFDLSKGLTQRFSADDGAFRAYDAGRIATIKHYADVAWSVNPDAHLLLEHFAEPSEERELSAYGLMVWAGAGLHNEYVEASMGYASDLTGADYRERLFDEPHLVAYMESHDEERMMFKNRNFGNSRPGYNIRDFSTALDRIELASVFFYAVPGPKMLWQFGELGYDFSINYCPDGSIQEGCRVDVKPIRWDYFRDPDRRELYEVVRALTFLKTNYEVFNTTDFLLDVDRDDWKRILLRHEEMDVLALGNFQVEEEKIDPAFPSSGWWYEYFSGDSLEVLSTGGQLTLAPGEYRLYTSAPVKRPDPIVTSRYRLVRDEFRLGVFPNPSAGDATITYSLENSGYVVLEVYNMLGKRLERLVSTRQASGVYTLPLRQKRAPGIYLLKLTVDNRIETELMLAH